MSTKNPCSCIRSTYAFAIDVISSGKVVYHDLSDWIIDDGYVEPDVYSLKVTQPNDTEVVFELTPTSGAVLDFESKNVDLRDGVYEFSVFSCGVSHSNTELLTPNTDCCLNKALISKVDKVEQLRELSDMLEAAKSAARAGKEVLAGELYNIVKRELASLKCDCNC